MRNRISITALVGMLVGLTALVSASAYPASAWQKDVPLDQALVLAGGESTNPRDYDPATTFGSGDKRIFSALVSFVPYLILT